MAVSKALISRPLLGGAEFIGGLWGLGLQGFGL